MFGLFTQHQACRITPDEQLPASSQLALEVEMERSYVSDLER
ncbi:MAG: hypothetical protein QM676_10785 [Novosphingobium sp.]